MNDLFAVFRFHFASLNRFGATVAAIVITTFVIVFVVAIAVSFVPRRCASRRLTEVIRVDALALQIGNFEFKKCVHLLVYEQTT